jgi:hypothetical protein
MAEKNASRARFRDARGLSPASRRGAARIGMRWPQLRPELFQYIGEDVRLADLCEAYETACAANEHWLKSVAGSARAQEYHAVAADVAGEIIGALADRRSAASASSARMRH